MRRSRGFTILELLIVLLIVVIMAGMAIDMFGGNRYERVDAGVSLLEADMGYARSLAIGSPSDPVMVRIAVDGTGYHVARASAPDTALTGPNGPLRVRFGEGRAETAAGVALTSTGSRDLRFGPFGGVMDPVPTLTVTETEGGQRAIVVLDPFTGDASVTYQSP
jgi:prepilin-type N-terminal cleavage/methylation domain-containing protein